MLGRLTSRAPKFGAVHLAHACMDAFVNWLVRIRNLPLPHYPLRVALRITHSWHMSGVSTSQSLPPSLSTAQIISLIGTADDYFLFFFFSWLTH